MLKITAYHIRKELEARGIKTEVVAERYGLMRYFHDGEWKLLRSCMTMGASGVGILVAKHKDIAHHIARSVGVRIPVSQLFTTMKSAHSFLREHGTVIVKPTDNGHGNGVTVNISSKRHLEIATKTARRASRSGGVLVQEHVKGEDVRVLVVGNKVAAAAKRVPAEVTGDGKHTPRQLIEIENADPTKRSKGYSSGMSQISIKAAEAYLGEAIDNVVPTAGASVRVNGPANIGAGGTSVDMTMDVPTDIALKAERISVLLGLPTCGVDFIVDDVADPERYHFIEVNACPSFGLHLYPTVGTARPVASLFVDNLLGESA